MKVITYLPDGSFYDKGEYDIQNPVSDVPNVLSDSILTDSIKRSTKILSAIGEVDLVWTGSGSIGVSSLLKDGVLVNSAIYLRSIGDEETEILEYFVEKWNAFPVVKELSKGNKLFQDVLKERCRPLMCSVNWSTLELEKYNKIANYDLAIGVIFFNL